MTRTTRLPTRMRARRYVGVLLGVLAITFMTTASAAQLSLATTDLSTYSAEKCSTATMSVHVSPTGFSVGFTKAAVQITNYPAACDGESVAVDIRNGAGASIATGTANCTGSPCVIPTGNYTAPNAVTAHVQASTWGLAASWDSACGTFLIFMNCT